MHEDSGFAAQWREDDDRTITLADDVSEAEVESWFEEAHGHGSGQDPDFSLTRFAPVGTRATPIKGSRPTRAEILIEMHRAHPQLYDNIFDTATSAAIGVTAINHIVAPNDWFSFAVFTVGSASLSTLCFFGAKGLRWLRGEWYAAKSRLEVEPAPGRDT